MSRGYTVGYDRAAMSHQWEEYARSLRWLRDIGEALSESRYCTTPKTVVAALEKLEASAKAWVAEATIKLNDSILKMEP